MNPQVNAILKQVHAVLMSMLHTAELDMAVLVEPGDIDAFLTNAAQVICFTPHT